jgi:hypothetical protein
VPVPVVVPVPVPVPPALEVTTWAVAFSEIDIITVIAGPVTTA